MLKLRGSKQSPQPLLLNGTALIILWTTLPPAALADITTTSQFIEQCGGNTPSIQCATALQINEMFAGGNPACYEDGVPANPHLDDKIAEKTNAYMRNVVSAIVRWLKQHPQPEDLTESTHAAALALYPCKKPAK